MAAIINPKYITDQTESIGSGSYGDVYTANLNVAIKKLRSSDGGESFEAEATNLLRAQHPNIIRLYGISIKKCEDQTSNRLVMEYADNKSLDEYIHNNKNKTITKSHRQNLMLQCAEGVAYLHSLTPLILHRDLKPANILLTNNYCTLKICDFGTARELGPEMTADKGTNVYRAPEIRHNQYTEKCDVYSLALILWEVMSGKKPFHKTDPAYTDAGIPYQTVRGVRPDLKDLNFCENVEIMKDLIEQGWDGEPCKRPSMKIFACYLALIIHR